MSAGTSIVYRTLHHSDPMSGHEARNSSTPSTSAWRSPVARRPSLILAVTVISSRSAAPDDGHGSVRVVDVEHADVGSVVRA